MRWILTQCEPGKDQVRTTLFDTAIFRYYELTVSATGITVSVGHKNYMSQEAQDFWRGLIVVVAKSMPTSVSAETECELRDKILEKMREAIK